MSANIDFINFDMLANSSIRTGTLFVTTPAHAPLLFLDPINGRLAVGTTAGSETIETTGNLRVGNIKIDTDVISSLGNITFAPTNKVNIPLSSFSIDGGFPGQVLSTDGGGTLSWVTGGGGGGGGSPAGNNFTIQYNDAGVFAGDDGLLWIPSSSTLKLGTLANGAGITTTIAEGNLPLYIWTNDTTWAQIEMRSSLGLILSTGGGSKPGYLGIDNLGAWNISASGLSGNPGDVLTSSGFSSSPSWQPPAPPPTKYVVANTTTVAVNGITETYVSPSFGIGAGLLVGGECYEIDLTGDITTSVNGDFNFKIGTVGDITDPTIVTVSAGITAQVWGIDTFTCKVLLTIRQVGVLGEVFATAIYTTSGGSSIANSGVVNIDTTQVLWLGVTAVGTTVGDTINVYQGISRQL